MDAQKIQVGIDWDGVGSDGVFPKEPFVVITGRPPEHEQNIKNALSRLGYADVPVYAFTGGDGSNKNEYVGDFKGKKIKELGISTFYEDTEEQIAVIKKISPNTNVIHVKPKKRKFVIVSEDFSGLGFALRLQKEGNEVIVAYKIDSKKLDSDEVKKGYELVGNGMVKKFPLEVVMKRRDSMREWYWVWDQNVNVAENEILRKEGFKVFLGGKFSDVLEHDRDKAVRIYQKYGIQSPPTFPFTDSVSAIKLLEQNPETAYVFKPDEGENFSTFCPESEDPVEANEEMIVHLQHLQGGGGFILQERKNGVETNIEQWYCRGEPVFAFMCIESKKKSDKDLGDMIGCAFDFAIQIPLDCLAVQQTVGKMNALYKEMKYTGYADANIIFANDGVWFFEACSRMGYNSHPNLFFNLDNEPVGQTIASLVDGTFTPNFAPGFGGSVTFYDEHPKMGKAIQFPESLNDKLYIWDAYKEKDQYLTAGYDNNILICLGYGYTIPTAWENVMVNADKVKFKGRTYRTDANRTDYPSSPIRRYEALVAMGLLEDKSMMKMHREFSDAVHLKMAESKKEYDDALAKEKGMHKMQMDKVKGMIKDAMQ